MGVPCCNPHDTYLSSMFLYSVLLSSREIFLFQSSLLYPTCHVSSPWQIMPAHPDIPCVACPVLFQLAQLFLLWDISPIPYIFLLFLNFTSTKSLPFAGQPTPLGLSQIFLTVPFDLNPPYIFQLQKRKMAVWGGLTNSCEKKRSKKQRRKVKL